MSVLTATTTWAEMIKFGHSIFALPFAISGAFLAGRELEAGVPGWGQFALLILCMVAARSVAMTFNRIVDADVDARNPRTRNRPMPAGRISRRQAWGFFVLCAGGFVLGCVGFGVFYGNYWPAILAVPVLAYLCGYSYCKFFTRWSHFYLGSAIALSPAAAWLAIDPASIGWPAVLLVGAVTMWIAGFDIIYACQDLDFDRREGLHSLPAKLGPAAALWIARGAHLLAVVLLAAVGVQTQLGWLYWIGVGIVAVLLAAENAIVHPHDFSRVNMAFFTVNGVVSVIMGIVTVADILFALQSPFAIGGAA